jgi:hypothetical protein
MILTNAFSLNMLSPAATKVPVTVAVIPLPIEVVPALFARGLTSAIGHADTAAVVGSVLGLPVPFARINVSLGPGDEIVVAQYRGPRLPEGCIVLPEGATIEFFHVRVGPF